MNRIYITALLMGLVLTSCTNTEDITAKITNETNRYDEVIAGKTKNIKSLSSAIINTPDVNITPEKISLGKLLYFDKRLSKDGNISCNSCHNLETFGVDRLPNSPGDGGQNGDRNSPTVLNAAYHSSQFWDGRASTVEQQAGMPIMNPIEMAIPSEAFLVQRLSGIELYKEKFKKAFPGIDNPITYTNIRNSIAAFERTLATPSRFDSYLNGDMNALTLQEKKGMLSFISVGCTNCHNGVALGGNMLQKFGVHDNYWSYTKSTHIDEGLFKITKQETDKYVFKVPSLRNIAETYPYFHDGSVNNLKDAVTIMAKTQLNVTLTKDEADNITAFLKSLTGEVPGSARTMPTELQ